MKIMLKLFFLMSFIYINSASADDFKIDQFLKSYEESLKQQENLLSVIIPTVDNEERDGFRQALTVWAIKPEYSFINTKVIYLQCLIRKNKIPSNLLSYEDIYVHEVNDKIHWITKNCQAVKFNKNNNQIKSIIGFYNFSLKQNAKLETRIHNINMLFDSKEKISLFKTTSSAAAAGFAIANSTGIPIAASMFVMANGGSVVAASAINAAYTLPVIVPLMIVNYLYQKNIAQPLVELKRIELLKNLSRFDNEIPFSNPNTPLPSFQFTGPVNNLATMSQLIKVLDEYSDF